MSEREGARVQLRWRDGHLDSAEAIGVRWAKPAPAWYWLDPVPVLPLPGPRTPDPWGAGLPDLHGHEPRELRLFWPRSAVHLVREAAGRYRWVELAEPVEPARVRTGWWGRFLARIRRTERSPQEIPSPVSGDWQTITVSRRKQPVILRRDVPASGHFEIVQYVADNRVLFWRLGWGAGVPAPGDILNTTRGD